jgi:hypothetical protein
MTALFLYCQVITILIHTKIFYIYILSSLCVEKSLNQPMYFFLQIYADCLK